MDFGSKNNRNLSFQINKKLGNVGLKLKDASDEHVQKRTLCKDQRYPK